MISCAAATGSVACERSPESAVLKKRDHNLLS